MTVSDGGGSAMLLPLPARDIDKAEDGLFIVHSRLEHLSMSNCIKPVDECHNYMNANVITYILSQISSYKVTRLQSWLIIEIEKLKTMFIHQKTIMPDKTLVYYYFDFLSYCYYSFL